MSPNAAGERRQNRINLKTRAYWRKDSELHKMIGIVVMLPRCSCLTEVSQKSVPRGRQAASSCHGDACKQTGRGRWARQQSTCRSRAWCDPPRYGSLCVDQFVDLGTARLQSAGAMIMRAEVVPDDHRPPRADGSARPDHCLFGAKCFVPSEGDEAGVVSADLIC